VVLTVLSIAVAFTLFGLLRPVGMVFESGANLAGGNRLVVSPRHSVSEMLPLGHANQIRQLAGVETVAHQTWFGGTYKDPKNTFVQYAITAEEYLKLYPEIILGEEEKKRFLELRTGAIIGKPLAAEFDLKVGDKLPFLPTIWMNKDNKQWEFELAGIYETADESTDPRRFMFHFDYFDEYRAFANGSIGNVIISVADPEDAASLASEVDALFANSPNETETATERDYYLSFLRQIGDIGLIVNAVLTAVFFTILLLTGNTMSQGIRDRIPEMAIMKTLGFKDLTILLLVLGESVTITIIGALGGIIVAFLMAQYIAGLPATGQFGPVSMDSEVIITAVIISIIMGISVGMLPALQAKRISIIDSLRRN